MPDCLLLKTMRNEKKQQKRETILLLLIPFRWVYLIYIRNIFITYTSTAWIGRMRKMITFFCALYWVRENKRLRWNPKVSHHRSISSSIICQAICSANKANCGIKMNEKRAYKENRRMRREFQRQKKKSVPFSL